MRRKGELVEQPQKPMSMLEKLEMRRKGELVVKPPMLALEQQSPKPVASPRPMTILEKLEKAQKEQEPEKIAPRPMTMLEKLEARKKGELESADETTGEPEGTDVNLGSEIPTMHLSASLLPIDDMTERDVHKLIATMQSRTLIDAVAMNQALLHAFGLSQSDIPLQLHIYVRANPPRND